MDTLAAFEFNVDFKKRTINFLPYPSSTRYNVEVLDNNNDSKTNTKMAYVSYLTNNMSTPLSPVDILGKI